MSMKVYSPSESVTSECFENVYCVFLHIVEGVGLNLNEGIGDTLWDRNASKVILKASLNGVKFEVEGHSTETATIFNNNCIWECGLSDIKRMKTDNRPVKLECFLKLGQQENASNKLIGTLLLPMRSLQTMANLRNTKLKLQWHKLGALSAEWRYNKPELYLFLVIVRKTLIETGQFQAFLGESKGFSSDILSPDKTDTTLMLQSRSNIYIQLLEQLGLVQVGNNPEMDVDIFNVSLTFKKLKNLDSVIEHERNYNRSQPQVLVFNYDFLGSVSHLDIYLNETDSTYTINEKITISYKSSLKSLRDYFERIFYIPINLYLGGVVIGIYRMEFSTLIPDDNYFHSSRLWSKNGVFIFDRFYNKYSPMSLKPSVDFVFTMHLISSANKRNNIHDNELAKNDSNAHNICIEKFESKIYKSKSEPVLFAKDTEEERYDFANNEVSNENEINNPDVDEKDNANYEEEEKINYSNSNVMDMEDIMLKTVMELENWKEQQINNFLQELQRKESEYLSAVQEEWIERKTSLEGQLQSAITECESLNKKLMQVCKELKVNKDVKRMRVDPIKCDILKKYDEKVYALEKEMKLLQNELFHKENYLDFYYNNMLKIRKYLEEERLELINQIEDLQKQLAAVKITHTSTNKLNDRLQDLRLQNDRVETIEKSKNYYKEQWVETLRELHEAKMKQKGTSVREPNSSRESTDEEDIRAEIQN